MPQGGFSVLSSITIICSHREREDLCWALAQAQFCFLTSLAVWVSLIITIIFWFIFFPHQPKDEI